MSRPLVLAHRGSSARETENTIEAFRAAIEDGAGGIELDVRLSADGEVVVFHDEDLVRLAGRPERVSRLPLAELRRVELAGGRRIPTLAETLEELGREPLVNVEVKSPGLGREGPITLAVARELRRAGGSGRRILVLSFDPVVLAILRARAPRLERALLFHGGLSRPLREAWSAPLLALRAVHPDASLVVPARLARWRRRGYRVNVWTVDEEPEIRALASLGVDGIVTNDPARALAALA
jgi:glycerophosphoryl diester phosphodiesterase